MLLHFFNREDFAVLGIEATIFIFIFAVPGFYL